jgi:hypothetical protein
MSPCRSALVSGAVLTLLVWAAGSASGQDSTSLRPLRSLTYTVQAGSQAEMKTGVSDHPSLSRAISLGLRDVSLPAALKEISARSGVPISYSRNLLPADRTVSVEADSISVRDALDIVLQGTPLDLWISRSGFVAIAPRSGLRSFGPPVRSLAKVPRQLRSRAGHGAEQPAASTDQQGAVSGRVTDAETQQPLAGVNVVVVDESDLDRYLFP